MLSEIQIERYSRQIILPEIGGRGQERLLSAAVGVVEAGPVGSAALVYLAAAGVGNVGMLDLGCAGDAGVQHDVLRADPAQLEALNPDCRISRLSAPRTADGAAAVVGKHDLIITAERGGGTASGVGAVTALLNDACVALRRPLVWARMSGCVGWTATLAAPGVQAACYQCLLPQLPPQPVATDAAVWLAAVTATLIGTVQATEAIKILLGVDPPLTGRLLTYDAFSGSVHEATVLADPLCATCSPLRRAATRG